jgi:hypothetical protein
LVSGIHKRRGLKVSELVQLLKFLAKTGVPYNMWEGKDFIDEDSQKDGAVLSISIRDSVHLDFDKKGNLVGSSTDSIKSHVRRKK